MNYDLFSESERPKYYAEFMVNALMRGDATARSQYYRERFNIGTLSRNDIRELENENPIPGGDTYYVNVTSVPLDEQGRPIPTPKITEPGTVTPDTPAQDPADPNAARALFLDIGERMAKRQAEQLRKLHKKGEIEWKSGLETHVADHKNALSRALKPAIEALFGAANRHLADDIASRIAADTFRVLDTVGYSGAESLLSGWESEQSESFCERSIAFLSGITTERAA